MARFSSASRIQGVSTAQTVKSTAGVLRRVVVANANAAVQTLTVADNTATKIVIQVPSTDTRQFDLDLVCTTSIKVTPSHANIDALIFYD